MQSAENIGGIGEISAKSAEAAEYWPNRGKSAEAEQEAKAAGNQSRGDGCTQTAGERTNTMQSGVVVCSRPVAILCRLGG